MEICNAGHCPPLYLHDGTISGIESCGLPLGLFPHAIYTSYHAKLGTGDRLLLHSDGLSETLNLAGDQYGNERLSEILLHHWTLPPDRMLAALLDDWDKFRSNIPIKDDLSIMVIGSEY